MLSLCCRMWAFSSCGEWGLLPRRGAQVSPGGVFSCCRVWALGQVGSSSCSMALESSWARTEPTSPALAGRFLTTGPPGKSKTYFLNLMPHHTEAPHSSTVMTQEEPGQWGHGLPAILAIITPPRSCQSSREHCWAP